MNNIQKRFLLFLFGCITIRSLFVYISKTIDIKYLPILGYIALLPSLGFMYIYLLNKRKTGVEVFGEKIWWNSLRPVHSIIYILFAYNAIKKNRNIASKILLFDVVLGLFSFIFYHSNQNGNLILKYNNCL